MAQIIERVGPCTLYSRGQPFIALLESIFSQQISTKVAAVLFTRFTNLFPRKRPTPKAILTLTDEQLQSCGLSRQKREYVRDLARRFLDGSIVPRRFPSMTDEHVIQGLTHVNGVGRWTAEMFLMFVLNRPDVLPVDDFGLQKNAQCQYKLRKLPDKARLKKLATMWQPWRTIATWYLWRIGDLKDN